jgi:DNA-binding transcriptional LysR family regulator
MQTVIAFYATEDPMLDFLPTFVAVAEAGSFAKVAKQEGVAVSSVTRRIDSLEAELGARLFSRSSRRVLLTDDGEQLLPRARAILLDWSETRESMSMLRAEAKGILTVTAPSVFGRRHVVPAVINFLKQYPAMEVDLHLADDVLDLTARRMDLAIRMGALPSSRLVSTQLAPFSRFVCASPEYLQKHNQPTTPNDLLQHNCLTLSSSLAPRGLWCFAGFNRDLPLPVRGTFRTDDTGSLVQAAIAGIGIVHLASWLVSDAVATGQLLVLFGQIQPPAKFKSAVHAVRLPGRSHDVKARLFIAHLRKAFGDPPHWERRLAKSS